MRSNRMVIPCVIEPRRKRHVLLAASAAVAVISWREEFVMIVLS